MIDRNDERGEAESFQDENDLIAADSSAAADASADGDPSAAADPSADGVVDDTDVPSNPDAATMAQSEAAYNAVHYSKPDKRKYRGPRSLAMLFLVLLGIVGLGVYAVIWFDNVRQKHERIELRKLEEQHVMSTVQQQNSELKQKELDRVMPGIKLQPANSLYKPLDPQEKARYDSLIRLYGTQFEPNENQKMLIEKTKKLLEASRPAATSPATKPAE